jgi:hypothetical protein
MGHAVPCGKASCAVHAPTDSLWTDSHHTARVPLAAAARSGPVALRRAQRCADCGSGYGAAGGLAGGQISGTQARDKGGYTLITVLAGTETRGTERHGNGY